MPDEPGDGGSDDPQPGHRCFWEWDGIEWQGTKSGCSVEEDCQPPGQPGNFIGQTAETPCEPL